MALMSAAAVSSISTALSCPALLACKCKDEVRGKNRNSIKRELGVTISNSEICFEAWIACHIHRVQSCVVIEISCIRVDFGIEKP